MTKKVTYILIAIAVLALGYYVFHRQLSNYSAEGGDLITAPTATPAIILRNDGQARKP